MTSLIDKLKARTLDVADTAKLQTNRVIAKAAPKYDEQVWNPLFKYPRNNPCLCESGKKWKKCCGPLQAPHIPKSEALDIIKALNALSGAVHAIAKEQIAAPEA